MHVRFASTGLIATTSPFEFALTLTATPSGEQFPTFKTRSLRQTFREKLLAAIH